MMKRICLFFLALLFILTMNQAGWSQDNAEHYKVDKIVLDAGHGGYDSGAVGKHSREKDITLAIALDAGMMIKEKLPGMEVIFTRTDDSFVKLHDRAEIANKNEADLFISIHCNSSPSEKAFGAETYIMGLHKTNENLEVAKAENAAILLEDNYQEQYDGFDPNSDEDYIMLNMFQSATMEQSLEFSQLLQDEMRTSAGLYDRGVRQAGFVVLYLTTMPGVLLETGFLSNPGEEQFLLKQENQLKIAEAIANAVIEYKHTTDEKLTELKTSTGHNALKPEKTQKIYRIEFISLKREKPANDKMFKGMEDVWHYFENGRYHYTFGKADSFEKANGLYQKAILNKKIKWKYLKSAEIVEFENGKAIKKIKALDNLKN
jgi:N-acetylmuramoyl-L-alanine amidase